ncbi:MAG: cell division protein ZapE [Hyphomicrobium sp.]|nr:cell division protein ZapE [Hyphomicrobium sp.]PPD07977.1 MAG: cell division protein ZapE [Hyphomicrobium sp.]
MPGRVWQYYQQRVASGQIENDSAQALVVERLDALAIALEGHRAERASPLSIFRPAKRAAQKAPRGLYVWGSVGRGKTMMMDLFHLAVGFSPRRRVHFHQFMAEVHERIARGRATTDGDPIPYVAGEIAGEAQLLCFDEFHVTDIADAMILGRLFKALFERGVIVVATSNVPPDRLYWNGLNRQLFLPFVAMLGEKLDVVEVAAARDYRLDQLQGQPLYFHPADDAARREIDAVWLRLTGSDEARPAAVECNGRIIPVPASASGVARFAFADLCGQPLAGPDYLAIARAYPTIIIEDVPLLTPDRRNEARRFITLIDTLYDRGACLVMSAAAEPDKLYPAGDGADLFVRTASRLMEMRSEGYLGQRGAGRDAGANQA